MPLTYRNTLIYACWLVMFIVVTPQASLGENWPGFRGPTRQGISNEKDVPVEWSTTSNIAWKTPVPGLGWSSPIVFGDRLFVTTATEEGVSFRLLCFDRQTGSILWNKQVLAQKTGNKQNLNSFATSTPVTDGRMVCTVAFDGSISAVSTDGNKVWDNRDYKYYSQHGLAISPILYQDLLIVAFDGSSSGPNPKVGWQTPWDKAVIVALDKNTGEVRWEGKRGSSRIAHVTPHIFRENGIDRLVSSAGDVVQGFDLKTGRRIWTVSSPGEGVVPSLVVGEGLVFTTSGFGDSAIRAVRTGGKGDVTETHIAWETTEEVPKIPSMLYVKPFLFLITESSVVRCLTAATGEVLWRQRLGGRYSASPVWANGRIYFLSEKGEAVVIEARPEFKVLARNKLEEKCCASPAISQGNIFIRSESNLFCIGPKP
jgi:outer membrane protein assembly factor BamB